MPGVISKELKNKNAAASPKKKPPQKLHRQRCPRCLELIDRKLFKDHKQECTISVVNDAGTHTTAYNVSGMNSRDRDVLIRTCTLNAQFQPTTRADQPGSINALGYCHPFVHFYPLTAVRGVLTVNKYLMEKIHGGQLNKCPPIQSFIRPKGQLTEVEQGVNIFTSVQHSPCIPHDDGSPHPPPPQIASILKTRSCCDDCDECKNRGCIYCKHCMLHLDTRDLSGTEGFLFQNPKTPKAHRAYFVMGKSAHCLAGGISVQYNGFVVPHGLWSPNAHYPGLAQQYPWYAAVVVKRH